MAVTPLSAPEVEREAAEALGLPGQTALLSAEGVASSLRRAASFVCPTTSAALSRLTVDVLRGLPGFSDETPPNVARILEDLVAYGDLLELPVEDEDGARRRLFLGPPAYVRRTGTNSALLLGVRSEGAPLIGDDLIELVEYRAHTRLFRAPDESGVGEALDNEGLTAVRPEQWLRAPRAATSGQLIDFYTSRLESHGLRGDVELRLIDPTSSLTYYRGRWREPKTHDRGIFVARRPQAFGADLWCLVERSDGRVSKLLDFPIENPLAPGADEAWRLQAALDASGGRPQPVRVREAADSTTSALEFFSPLPSWAQRRLDVIGSPTRAAGALFAYELPAGELQEELDFLASMLWIEQAGSP